MAEQDVNVASAKAKYIKVPPRKIARLARECVGVKVSTVKPTLSFYPQKAARVLLKVVASAEANLKQKGQAVEDAVVRSISVDKGMSYKRLIYRAKGRADRKEVKTAHISVEVGSAVVRPAKKVTSAKKVAPKTTKAPAPTTKAAQKPEQKSSQKEKS